MSAAAAAAATADGALSCCCYEEARSPRYGRHLVAARDLPPGQVVVAHAPFAAVLLDDQVAARCDYCFAPPPTQQPLMRCTRSKLAHYDSQAHQRAAWRAYYRDECAALIAVAPRVPPSSVRLAARVLWRRAREVEQAQGGDQQQQQQQQQAEVAGGRYTDVEALLSHWQELPGSRKIQYAQMAVLTRQLMLGDAAQQQADTPQPAADALTPTAAAAGPPDVKAIAALLARFGCNNHTICDEELRPIGVGLYPLGALVNHSCRPNCVQSFQGPNIVFRSLRAIPAGEQLTISYVELAATRQERRRQLLQQYFFDIDWLTGATADAGQVGGVVQLQLVCRLPELHAAAAAAASQDAASDCMLPVTCHSTSSSPPWPADAADKQLCQMLLLPPPSAGKQGEPLQLPGGMCLLPVLLPASSRDQDAAATLFQDLDLDAQASTQVDAAGRSDDDAGSERQQQQQPQQPQLQAVQWGEWGAATSSSSSSSISSVQEAGTSELAVTAAGALMAVHSLKQQADRVAAQGDASAAVRLCQQALAVADGAAPGLAMRHAAAAAASDADAAATSSSTSSSSRCSWRVQLGPRHVLRARATAGLLKAAVDASEWQVALAAARALVPVYQLVYPRVWPNLGLHYALLAKLEMFLEHPAAAAQAAEAAGRSLQVTHGPGSSVMKEVMRIAYEAAQELAAAADANT